MFRNIERRAGRAIVVYDPHPHVSIFREFAGYVINNDADIGEEDNTEYLRSLDPKDWKTNDHYAVMNLKNIRYKASDEEIRKQYRKLVLKHHPDKRRARGEDVRDISHDYFACITQASEILCNPTKRLAYDSVDPLAINETIPSVSKIKKDFFGTLSPIFFENARWSKKQPVPYLGNNLSHVEAVYRFYDFWDSYETTKDYSFLDEEDKEKGEDRESRRYIELANRKERAKKKADEHKRIRQLVELAREHDPRLAAVARAAKQAKEIKKAERVATLQKRREQEEERAQAEAAEAEAARIAMEEASRLESERLKKERDAVKTTMKREKKRLRNICVEQFDHFIKPIISNDPSKTPDEIKIDTLQDIELLCQVLSGLELSDFNNKLQESTEASKSFTIWQAEIARVRKQIEAPGLTNNFKYSSTTNGTAVVDTASSSKWTHEMTQNLIKAVNLFPAGTQKRWEVIAAYVSQHITGVDITGKEALKQAKNLRNDDLNRKQESNLKAFDSFTSQIKPSEATKSVVITDIMEADSIRPWSVSEQRLLEKALRTHPVIPGEPPAERWLRIADSVGTRTRKECMIRYKDLAEQIKLKKAAMIAVGVSSKKS